MTFRSTFLLLPRDLEEALKALALLTELQKGLNLLAELRKALSLLAALRKIKAMPSGRGRPFPASEPFTPAGRGERAGKPM